MRLALAALVIALAGCVAGPSYEGGPDGSEPHGIVQSEDSPNLKLWTIDGKIPDSHTSAALVAPGNRRLKFRIDYPIEDDSMHPFEYIEYPLQVDEGVRYRFTIAGEYEKGPPYTLDVRMTKIRDYGK